MVVAEGGEEREGVIILCYGFGGFIVPVPIFP